MSSFFLLVPAKKCQITRDCLRRERLLAKGGQRVDEKSDVVAIPVRMDEEQVSGVLQLLAEEVGISVNEVEVVPRLTERKVVDNAYKRMCDLCQKVFLKHDLRWTDDLKVEVPTHWEKHNDLALFAENAFKSEIWFTSRIRDDLWPSISRILAVNRLARKSAITDNDFRSPKVEIFFGDQYNTWVSRKENGIVYHWDITRSMFSAGNISEKLRIAKLDCSNEVVVDLFAGIGYFTLPYLVHAQAQHVHACEWNPAAVEALAKNLQTNNVKDRCTLYPGDNRVVCPRNIADRVNLGLLPTAETCYRTACLALKRQTGGMLHIHENVRTEKKAEPDAVLSEFTNVSAGASFRCQNLSWKSWCFRTADIFAKIFVQIYPDQDWSLELIHLERVKSFAPHVDHLVLDLLCKPVGK